MALACTIFSAAVFKTIQVVPSLLASGVRARPTPRTQQRGERADYLIIAESALRGRTRVVSEKRARIAFECSRSGGSPRRGEFVWLSTAGVGN